VSGSIHVSGRPVVTDRPVESPSGPRSTPGTAVRPRQPRSGPAVPTGPTVPAGPTWFSTVVGPRRTGIPPQDTMDPPKWAAHVRAPAGGVRRIRTPAVGSLRGPQRVHREEIAPKAAVVVVGTVGVRVVTSTRGHTRPC
jgi:hypothetical protein